MPRAPPKDYHDQKFLDRNYGRIRSMFESPARRVIRHEGIAFIGEFLGTFGFLFMAYLIAQIALTPDPAVETSSTAINHAKLIMVSFGFGLALMTNIFIWFRVCGAAFNPAVSLGLAVMGVITPGRAFVCIAAQVLAGIVAALVVDGLTIGPLLVANGLTQTENSVTSATQGFFIEALGTCQLMLIICKNSCSIHQSIILTIVFMACEHHAATPMAALAIGLALVGIHLEAVNYTGCGVNPARFLGPAVVTSDFPQGFWIYIVGPCVGSLVACAIYAFIKWAGYNDVCPGQDATKGPDADYIAPMSPNI
jgi:aquaporin related protein